MRSKQFDNEVLASVNALKIFAIKILSGNRSRVEDAVQETLMKAFASSHMYIPGTNMKAWLITILRNLVYSNYRKGKREVEDVDGLLAANLSVAASQDSHMEFLDTQEALKLISPEHQEILLVHAVRDNGYEATAQITGAPIGTVKSRISRARIHLKKLLSDEAPVKCGVSKTVATLTPARVPIANTPKKVLRESILLPPQATKREPTSRSTVDNISSPIMFFGIEFALIQEIPTESGGIRQIYKAVTPSTPL